MPFICVYDSKELAIIFCENTIVLNKTEKYNKYCFIRIKNGVQPFVTCLYPGYRQVTHTATSTKRLTP